MSLHLINQSVVGEDHQVRVRRSDEKMLDVIVVFGHRAKAPLAAASLTRISRHRSSLDVTTLGHRDRDFFVGNQVFDGIVHAGIGNLSPAGVAKLGLDLFEFFDDHAPQRFFIGQNFFQLGNQFDDRLVLVNDLLPLERGKPPQL